MHAPKRSKHVASMNIIGEDGCAGIRILAPASAVHMQLDELCFAVMGTANCTPPYACKCRAYAAKESRE
jgi:hypothetical protein